MRAVGRSNRSTSLAPVPGWRGWGSPASDTRGPSGHGWAAREPARAHPALQRPGRARGPPSKQAQRRTAGTTRSPIPGCSRSSRPPPAAARRRSRRPPASRRAAGARPAFPRIESHRPCSARTSRGRPAPSARGDESAPATGECRRGRTPGCRRCDIWTPDGLTRDGECGLGKSRPAVMV